MLIGSAIAIFGQFMGVNAVLYGPSILKKAAFQRRFAVLSVIDRACKHGATILALLIIDKVGRKNWFMWAFPG